METLTNIIRWKLCANIGLLGNPITVQKIMLNIKIRAKKKNCRLTNKIYDYGEKKMITFLKSAHIL